MSQVTTIDGVVTGNADWTHTWQTGDPETASIRCAKCFRLLPFNRQKMPWTRKCSCGEYFCVSYSKTQDHRVDADEAVFFDADVARNTVWYHATTSPHWYEDVVSSGAMVHVGSMEAARDRMTDVLSMVKDTDAFFIYEIVLNDDAVIANAVYPDMNDLWRVSVNDDLRTLKLSGCFETSEGPVPMERFLREMYDPNVDVIRYVNRYEWVGGVSLLINPNKMRVVNRVQVGGQVQ